MIDWTKSATEIDRRVRAFNPWPIAETRWEGQQLRIWESVVPGMVSHLEPGSVVTATRGINVATGVGVLRLTRVQLAGRRAVSAADFVNAHRLDGTRLPS